MLPPLKECIIHSTAIETGCLGNKVRTLWGTTINNPLVINTYRQFLKRVTMPVDENGIIDSFVTRASANLDDKAITLLKAIVPYTPPLVDPPKDWSNRCKFGPGQISESNRNVSEIQKIKELVKVKLADSDQPQTSRIILVPKDWKKKRLIAAEPVEKGFLQHGLASVLMDSIEQCSPIRFADQDQNRERCDMAHATIDLSDASDSVLLDHVRILMPGWHTDLERVRSTHASYDARSIELSMYGTMGSACTFPTETWVFYSLTYGIMNKLGSSIDELQDIRVFGDDIVVPEVWGETVADFLSACGFNVNRGKSFWGLANGYRETCGKETFFDRDVTPLRLPRGATEKWFESVDPASFAKFCDSLSRFGAWETARVFLDSWQGCDDLRANELKGGIIGITDDPKIRTDDPHPLSAWHPYLPVRETNFVTTTERSCFIKFSSEEWEIFARDWFLRWQAGGDRDNRFSDYFDGSCRYDTQRGSVQNARGQHFYRVETMFKVKSHRRKRQRKLKH